jgi:hypothetical protein
MYLADCGYDLGRMLDFVVAADSQFYPEFGSLYGRRIISWGTRRPHELGERGSFLNHDAGRFSGTRTTPSPTSAATP